MRWAVPIGRRGTMGRHRFCSLCRYVHQTEDGTVPGVEKLILAEVRAAEVPLQVTRNRRARHVDETGIQYTYASDERVSNMPVITVPIITGILLALPAPAKPLPGSLRRYANLFRLSWECRRVISSARRIPP